MYGSTETTGDVLCEVIDLKSSIPATTVSEYVPVGRPIADSSAYILDNMEEPVGDNSEGEIYVSGPLVVDGYLDGNDFENYPFMKNPFVDDKAAQRYVIYRTVHSV